MKDLLASASASAIMFGREVVRPPAIWERALSAEYALRNSMRATYSQLAIKETLEAYNRSVSSQPVVAFVDDDGWLLDPRFPDVHTTTQQVDYGAIEARMLMWDAIADGMYPPRYHYHRTIAEIAKSFQVPSHLLGNT